MPSKVVYFELLEAHKQKSAARAINNALRSHNNATQNANMLPANLEVRIYYQSFKQNEKDEWNKDKPEEATEHFVLCKRTKRGPPTRVAYEQIWVAPKNALATELQSSTLEDLLGEGSRLISWTSHKHVQKEDHNEFLETGPEFNSFVELPALHSNLLSHTAVEDVGFDIAKDPEHDSETLSSIKHNIIEKLHRELGNKTVTLPKNESASSCLLQEAIDAE